MAAVRRAVPIFSQKGVFCMSVKRALSVKKLVMAGLCLALCLVLPFLTGQIPKIGSMLSPMHIPVLLCGFLCGWPWALAVGLIAPPLRYLLFGMPPLFPTGAAMMVELAVYGAMTGLLYHLLPKKPGYVYVTLVLAMLLGRAAWGVTRWLLMAFGAGAFTFQAFLAGAFLNAWPGIICHLVLIPPLVLALEKAKVISK